MHFSSSLIYVAIFFSTLQSYRLLFFIIQIRSVFFICLSLCHLPIILFSTKIETGDINIMACKEQRIEKEKLELEITYFNNAKELLRLHPDFPFLFIHTLIIFFFCLFFIYFFSSCVCTFVKFCSQFSHTHIYTHELFWILSFFFSCSHLFFSFSYFVKLDVYKMRVRQK
jgi:hypothetical protein